MSQRGATLPFVVLLMLGLLGLAHGVLVAALSEAAASRAAARELGLRGAADRALLQAMATLPSAWADGLVILAEHREDLGPVGNARMEGAWRRLGRESWLVEGLARSPSGVVARSRRLGWSLDPAARVMALSAAVTVGMGAPVGVDGSVDAADPAEVIPPMTASDCEPWSATLVQRFLAEPLSAVEVSADSAAPGLGLIDFASLLSAAPVSLRGSGTPAPEEATGVCLEGDPWMWGDPDRPWRPCGGYMLFGAADGDVTMDGGAGQGILVVDGDLTLDSGARFYGMVVTTGLLRLAAASRLEGMVLAAGGLSVGSGSTVRASACWAARVLDAHQEALGHLLPVGVSRLGPE